MVSELQRASRSPGSTNRVSLSCSEEGGLRPSHRAGSTGGDERRSRLWESNGSGTHFWIDHRCDQEFLPTPMLSSMETNMVR